jgi:hypothetical protein
MRPRLGSILPLLATIALVGCVGITATPSPSSAAPTTSTTIGVSPTAAAARRTFGRDPSGDLVDANGAPVLEPRNLDITRLEADAIGSDLRLQLTLKTAPPPNVEASVRAAAYVIGLNTAGAEGLEYLVHFENRVDGAWTASLEDRVLGQRFENTDFRGSVYLQERVILFHVPLSSLGSPAIISVCAHTESAARADGQVAAEDDVPDGDCLHGASMLTLQ